MAGLAGLAFGIPLQQAYRKWGDARSSRIDPWQVAVLLLWSVSIGLLLWRWAQMRYPQGRLLFPAISSTAVLLAWGLSNWLPRRWQRWLPVGLALLLIPIAASIPWRTIAPSTRRRRLGRYQRAHELDALFGDQLRLTGFELDGAEIRPGEAVPPHPLLGGADAARPRLQHFCASYRRESDLAGAAQTLIRPSNAPTSDWPTGVVLPDAHEVTVPTTAPAPALLKVDVGVYDYATGERLLVGGHDHWTVGYVTLVPAVEGAPCYVCQF